jgi:HAD superfamily hydrolase (TIGR01509 family)
MIRAAIFDMDGLLIDSEPLWQRAETEIFGDLGLRLTSEMCRQTVGMRALEMVSHWHDRHPWSGATPVEVMHRIIARLEQLVQSVATPMEGVMEAFAKLSAANIRMVVASSSPQAVIDSVIESFRLGRYIQFALSAEAERYGKPHPAIFLTAAERLGVSPKECIVFEDSIAGVIAAKAARMTTIAVPAPDQYGRPEFSIADSKLRSLMEFDPADFPFEPGAVACPII